MNMQVLDARRDASGGYKVDVTRGERIGRVSSEWFSRPEDERYLSLSALYNDVHRRTERSRTRVVESALIHVEADRNDPERLSLILPGADAASQSNVRRVKAGVSIDELAESIARRGLIQSLHVRPVIDADGHETGMFEVPAGGRRYRALELLAKQKRLAKTALVPCIVSDPASQVLVDEISLAENIERAPLHPLDQFRAFLALRDKGLTEEAIAAAFFVPVQVVKQRLRLASVSPALLDVYAEDGSRRYRSRRWFRGWPDRGHARQDLDARRDDIAEDFLGQERGLVEEGERDQHEAGQRRQLELDERNEELDGKDEEGHQHDQPGDHQHEVLEERDVAHELTGSGQDGTTGIEPDLRQFAGLQKVG